ncbi:MAG: histidine phosphatase family protein, partial [Rhodococcus fascians]
MTFLALVRHGETDWNLHGRLQGSSDIPLNDTGRAQAREAVYELSDHSWDLLVSSPLSRAAETADIIGSHLGISRTATYPDLA